MPALLQVSCELEFPGNCRRAYEPLDVLTELPFLLAFALGQASAIWSTAVNKEIIVGRKIIGTHVFRR